MSNGIGGAFSVTALQWARTASIIQGTVQKFEQVDWLADPCSETAALHQRPIQEFLK